MDDHLVLCVDNFIPPKSASLLQGPEVLGSSVESLSSRSSETRTCAIDVKVVEKLHGSEEEEPLIQTVECRICQEEDGIKNLEIPCACNGSLKYAHRKCVQRWCDEKGDITCEICNQHYQPGYIVAPPSHSEDNTIDISDDWTVTETTVDLRDPRLLAMAAAERHLSEGEYDEYADSGASGATFCRSTALILMALLLLRHALTLTNGDGDDGDDGDEASAFFLIFLLRAAGFLLPCYIMAWAISILQRLRERQEEAAMRANGEAAFMQIAPGPALSHQNPVQ